MTHAGQDISFPFYRASFRLLTVVSTSSDM
jgi:hypothetical protein